MKQIMSIQDWIPIEDILENGIIKLKTQEYVKIIQVEPLNLRLKTELEKKTILNSYKNFLKTCSFDMQIIIQSKKEDLSYNISLLEKNIISEKYIKFIKKLNSEKKSASKNFYIIVKDIQNDLLESKYLKIKECLLKCGNNIQEINKKEQIKEILNSFFNM